ncbi:MAG: alpha/beta fold hydrolase [Burkholderiales bacterium]|jgi:pimeloyl-ACP methyl ester carboxylesterase
MQQLRRFLHAEDGLRLQVAEYLGAADSPVLCLHGLTRNGRDFSRLATHLAAHHRVLCPDQRGRGLSERDPDPTRYRPDVYVADMLRLIDQLGLDELTVIGTSLGGMMGVMLAAALPGRVKALVLNDVGPVLEPTGLARIGSYVGRQTACAHLDEAIERTAQTQAVVFPDFQRRDWQQMVLDTHVVIDEQWLPDYDPAIALGLANGSAAPPLWPLFEAARETPMLLLRGALSDLLSPVTMAEMQSRLPRLEAVEVPNRGHAPTLDEPVARQAIDDFLRRLDGR